MNLDIILSNLAKGFPQIAKSFTKDLSILWLITPVLLFWIIIEIYLDRYKKEDLGWNTALGNGLSVLWVSLICLRFLFELDFKHFQWSKLIALIIIFIYGCFVVINSYYHRLKKKVSFVLASPTPIYFLSLVAILWTYGYLPINFWIILDLIILYTIIGLIELILKKIVKEKEVVDV